MFAQGLDGAALGVHGLAAALLALAKLAFGFAHGGLGVVHAVFAIHAELLHALLQVFEALAQRLLALGERFLVTAAVVVFRLLIAIVVAGIGLVAGLLTLLTLLTLLAALALLLLTLLAILGARLFLPVFLALVSLGLLFLIVAEGLVAQLLLFAAQLIQFVDGAVHFARSWIRPAWPPRGLQIFHQVLQLVEQLLRARRVAVFHHLLHAVDHGFELVWRHHALVVVLRVLIFFGVAGHFVEELVHRGAQLVHQPLDFLVRRAALQGVAKLLFGGAQIALGFRQVSALDAQRHFPHEIGDIEQVGVVFGRGEARGDRGEAQKYRARRPELVGRDHQRVDRGADPFAIVRREDQVAALFNQRARQRLGEYALRQGDFNRLAAPFVAAFVFGGQSHRHARAGPRMLRQIRRCFAVAEAAPVRGQRQRHFRGLGQRSPRHRASVDDRRGEFRFRANDAVIVVDLVLNGERAPRVRRWRSPDFDCRRQIGN